ncbi:MAG: sugar ABC transporter permease [Chloroflexi bacterium]|nr:sugar ABC transporter permease [Chloroflexota bacterium]
MTASTLVRASCWRQASAELTAYVRHPRKRGELLTAISFLAPSALILLVFVVLPVVGAFLLSFAEWNLLAREPSFVGLQNYIDMLRKPDLWRVIRNTLYFSILKIPVDMALSLGIALLLNQKLRGLSFYRTAFFLPVITSVVAVSAVWRWIYDPNLGLANAVLRFIGLPAQTWLSDPKLAMPAVALVALWKGLGYDVVIYLAGLQNIPAVYHEAAQIDGANAWQRFRYVTWPLLSPITYFILIIGIINSFKVFAQIHVLTPDGGPLGSTEVIVFYIYRLAFQQYNFGRAAAVAFILFAIVVSLTALQRRFIEPRVHYE